MSKRVLYVNTPTYTGGAEISLLTLMRYLDPNRYAPFLITSGPGGLLDSANQYGIPVLAQEFAWFRKRRPWRYPRSIFDLVRTIRRERISIVHTNCDLSLRYVARACTLTQTPYVSHVRDGLRAWFEPPQLYALNRARKVIANAESVAEMCIKHGVRSELVCAVDNPIELDRFAGRSVEERALLRESFGIPENALVFGLVGQIFPLKGQTQFVSAAATVAQSVPQSHFLIVGEATEQDGGEYLRTLTEIAVSNRIEERVHFVGFHSDITQILAILDVLAVPHLGNVGFARVVLEGMAAGVPVIASSIYGVSEVMRDRCNGLLVAPGDIDALATSMISLANDPKLRQGLSQEGSLTVERFAAPLHAAKIQGIYDVALGVS